MWRMIFKEYGKAIFQCGQQLPGIFWKESQEMGLIDTLRDQFFQDQESPGDSLRVLENNFMDRIQIPLFIIFSLECIKTSCSSKRN